MAWFSHLLTLAKPPPKNKTAASAAAPAPGWMLSDCSSENSDEEVSVLDVACADLDALEAELTTIGRRRRGGIPTNDRDSTTVGADAGVGAEDHGARAAIDAGGRDTCAA